MYAASPSAPRAERSAFAAAALAVAKAAGRPEDAVRLSALLSEGSAMATCIASFWLDGKALDAGDVANRFRIGANLAYALVVTVEDLDPLGLEVETVRIAAWIGARGPNANAAASRPNSPPSPPPSDSPPQVDDDMSWFARNPLRIHRVSRGPDGWVAARRGTLEGGMGRIARLPAAEFEAVPEDEEGAREAFRDAAMGWLRANQPGDVISEDAAWFATRPERGHRIRPALSREVEGRDPAGWVVIVAHAPGVGEARIVVKEATLPHTDRGEADLKRIMRAAASDMAAAFDAPDAADETGAGQRALPVARKRGRARVGPRKPGRNEESHGPLGKTERRAPEGPVLDLGMAATLLDGIIGERGPGPFRAFDVRRACAARFGGDGLAALMALKHHGLLLAGASGLLHPAPGLINQDRKDGLSPSGFRGMT